jgi:hypothetical protein
MLDINKIESKNEVYVSGILNELEIVEGITNDGRGWVRGNAQIRVDQEIDGVVTENIIPVRMFSMRKKKDGTDNKVYDRIVGYKEKFTSLAAADDESEASKITISNGRIEENPYVNREGNVVSSWQISANFLNDYRNNDEESAKFEVVGVIANIRQEVNRDGDETGRDIISLVLVGYAGKANVIDLIASGSAKDFIETNWNKGDTVHVTGRISMTRKVVTWKEEQGFGEPILRSRTESRKELIITGGSPSGLEEALSYDANDVKIILNKRKADHEALKNERTAKVSPKKTIDLGF